MPPSGSFTLNDMTDYQLSTLVTLTQQGLTKNKIVSLENVWVNNQSACECNCINESNTGVTTVFCYSVNVAAEITHSYVTRVLKNSELEGWSMETRRTAGAKEQHN